MKYQLRILEDLGIDRASMPQFPKANLDMLLADLKSDGIPVHRVNAPVTNIKPSQRGHDPSHAVGIAQKMAAGEFPLKPLLVSKDWYLLDGHHRWAASKLVKPKGEVPVIWIGLNFKDLLSYADKHSGPRKTL